MTELEEKPQGQADSKPIPTQEPAAAQANSEQVVASTPEKTNEKEPAHLLKHSQMSKGEKLYNRVLYQGVNYWLNMGISMAVTDLFLHKDPSHGKIRTACTNFFDKTVAGWTKGLTKTGLSEGKSRWFSKIALSTFTLNSGGNILIVPTKLAEDRKRGIVHWINEHVYNDKQLGADGHKLTADEIYIEHEQPKQTWSNMIVRRLKGWGATTAVGLTLDVSLAKRVTGTDGVKVVEKAGQEVFTEAAVKNVNKVLGKIPGVKNVTKNETFERYLSYASLDSIYTLITSVILHRTNGAGKGKAPKEIGDDTAPLIHENSEDALQYIAQPGKPDQQAKADCEPCTIPRAIKESISPSPRYVSASPRTTSSILENGRSESFADATTRSKLEQNNLALPS